MWSGDLLLQLGFTNSCGWLSAARRGVRQDIAILVYGRAVAALKPKTKGIPERCAPPSARRMLPVRPSTSAKRRSPAGIDEVVPEAQRVPQGAVKIAELVSEGFVPMQY